MQRFLLTLTILILTVVNLPGQWQVLNKGIKGWVSSVDFINDKRGWMAGSDGLLFKTEDGGLTWNSIQINEDWFFNKIDFIDERTGWAICWASNIESDVILKTEDGGYNWIIQHEQNDLWYNDLHALNDSIVYVCTDTLILKSANGGSDWADFSPGISNSHLYSVSFLDALNGVVSGEIYDDIQNLGFISRTTDGGLNWENSIINEFTYINNPKFGSDSMAYFIAENWESDPGYFLFQTRDMGQTREVIYRNDHPISSYFILNNQTIYVAAMDSLNDVNILKSVDAGENWETIYSLTNWWISFMQFNQEDIGLIICQLGGRGFQHILILTNRFDGINWQIRTFSYDFTDICFIDQDRGFTVGGYHIFHGPSGGDIFSTNDGGNTWFPNTSLPGWIRSCQFFNDSTGYVMTREWPWMISKTTDSGMNWQTVYENNFDSTAFEFYGYDIYLLSEKKVLVAGNYWTEDSNGAAIFQTSDGGLTWDFLWKYPGTEERWYDLTSLYIVDEVIWAVGPEGFIVKIVDPDSFQVINFSTDLPLNDVFFSDPQHGWIAGGYGYDEDFHPLLLRTADGGETWNKQENFPYVINELFFRDSLQGWGVGFDRNQAGLILATNNGGKSWSMQADLLPAPLHAIHFIDDLGWAAGEGGLLLQTDNGGINWIDQNTGTTYPNKFNLSQNYPNPFNPATVIEFQIPNSAFVTLEIYNILGEKVSTLLSAFLLSGFHSYEWDASNFASGVYYYKLKTGHFEQVKKMVLLK
jgi:photosystem II stability/assembly factor-like uncharacterized protein